MPVWENIQIKSTECWEQFASQALYTLMKIRRNVLAKPHPFWGPSE